ncbi:hypothetical protein GTJ93_15890 [Escherichia coli]|nr:hypothetical protein [Escherichia coli]
MLWQQQYDILYTLSPCLKTCTRETGMARSEYDFINLSLEHELNEWLAERGYAVLAYNRNRVAEVVTCKLQDSFYVCDS